MREHERKRAVPNHLAHQCPASGAQDTQLCQKSQINTADPVHGHDEDHEEIISATSTIFEPIETPNQKMRMGAKASFQQLRLL